MRQWKRAMQEVGKILFVLCLCAGGLFAAVPGSAEEPGGQQETPFQTLGQVETILFGSVQTGGLVSRLGKVEQDLFGRELPGSIAERQQALLDFIQKGSGGQPSFLFKLGVAEWAVTQRAEPLLPASERIRMLEEHLEGSAQQDRPLAMRLERVIQMLLGDGILWEETKVPAGTVMKVELGETLSPKLAKPGDVVQVHLAKDLVVNSCLVAPKGSVVKASVADVKPPRSFGRSSEVKVGFDVLLPLGPTPLPVTIGESAKKAAEGDKAVMAAAGASFLGLVVLGPVGLAGGFFVRGDDRDLPEGTQFYVEAREESRVQAFPVPQGLRGLLKEGEGDAASPDVTPAATP